MRETVTVVRTETRTISETKRVGRKSRTVRQTTSKRTAKRRTRTDAPPKGVVFYRGPSALDGAPVVGIATFDSDNPKTGDMVQCWILREDVNPVDALRTGDDASICGDCPHRPAKAGSCYVSVGKAPLAIWRTFRKGGYRTLDRAAHLPLFKGRLIRLGAYGDPCAIPLDAWIPLLLRASGHTGYTHQWRTCDQTWRSFVMASVDNVAEREQAVAAGWRTFRVRTAAQPLLAGEITCPASDEAGKSRQCSSCRACDGQTASGRGATVAIVAHGGGVQSYKAKRFAPAMA